jgi:hypothetical protein
MVHGRPALGFLVVLEHREIDHPQRPPAFRDQLCRIVADLQAQRAERVVDDLGLVGAEEDQVAVGGAGALEDLGQRRVVRNFTIGDCRPSRPLARR